MGALDFLFEGKPPTAVTTYGQTTEETPKWLSDYTQGLIAKANAVAAEPYQAYGGPRIAGFTPDQMASFEATRGSIGAADPFINQATGMAYGAGQIDPLASASPFMESAAQNFPGQVQDYMNPYLENVLSRQEEMAGRSLTEKFLPQLQDTFTSSGQYGSQRMQEQAQKGVRDITENLESQRLATMADAYGQAGQMFQSDAARQAQLASTAGGLATARGELGLAGSRQMGALGEFTASQRLRDAAALEAIGSQQQGMGQRSLDTAYQDFLSQRDYPRQNVDWLSSVIRGIPYDRATTTTETGPASQYQASPISQLGSLASAYKGWQEMNRAEGGHIKKSGALSTYNGGR